jgi:hypothetical protein
MSIVRTGQTAIKKELRHSEELERLRARQQTWL